MWYILENVPCALVKSVYSAALEWNSLKISVKSIWSSVSVKAAVSLLIFCLQDLSIDVNGEFKSPTMTIIVNFSLSVHQHLLYRLRCFYVEYISVYNGYILMLDCSLYHIYVLSLFASYCSLCFKVYFIWYKYWYPQLFFFAFPFSWNIFFHPFTFHLCVSLFLDGSLIDSICTGLVFISIQLLYVFLAGAFTPFTCKVVIDKYIFIVIEFFIMRFLCFSSST